MDVTFLTKDQIFGDKALSVLKDYGTGVGYSDLAVLQSGMMSGSNKNIEGKRTGSVWSAAADKGTTSFASALEAMRTGITQTIASSPRALLCHHR